MTEIQNARLATLVTLAERAPRLDRTALMKLCYFLQALRHVPLGYRFTLYSYGPFDSSVLSDVASAEVLGGLRSDIILYSKSYAYEIKPSEKSEVVKALAADFVKRYDADVNWVIKQFGGLGSGDFELLSTIVYVDRESGSANERLAQDELIQTVHEVKPHLDEAYIREKVADLAKLELLHNLGAASARASAA